MFEKIKNILKDIAFAIRSINFRGIERAIESLKPVKYRLMFSKSITETVENPEMGVKYRLSNGIDIPAGKGGIMTMMTIHKNVKAAINIDVYCDAFDFMPNSILVPGDFKVIDYFDKSAIMLYGNSNFYFKVSTLDEIEGDITVSISVEWGLSHE